MKTLVLHLLINALAVLAGAYLLPGVRVDGFWAALLVAVVLGIVNAFVRPIVVLLTLPLTVITLGLFLFVINALMILLVDGLVAGFAVGGFWWALLYSFVVSIVATLLNSLRKTTLGPPPQVI